MVSRNIWNSKIRISLKGGEEGERKMVYRKQDFVVLQER